MKQLVTTLIVLLCFSTSASFAQNQDNFESLITLLQDRDSQEIVYTVQLGAFRNDPLKGHFENVENLFSQSYSDGLTRFFAKLFKSLPDAVAHRDKLRQDGFPDAFVLGLDGGFDRILIEVD